MDAIKNLKISVCAYVLKGELDISITNLYEQLIVEVIPYS